MNENDYQKLLATLDSAKKVIAKNSGSLSAADLRIQCLVNITQKETQRAMLEAAAASEPKPAPIPATRKAPGFTTPHSQTTHAVS